MTHFRSDARKALERAKAELASGDDKRLKYAALELRMAMESVTYDRASAYKEEFPEDEYDTWQPKKVMAVLLEIDEHADSNCSLAIGEEPASGVPAPVMHSLGTETVLNLVTIKRHYDALGSYLHVQTLRQVRTGAPVDFKKLRDRCEAIVEYLSAVLASPVWNMTFAGAGFASFDCLSCESRIRRRLPLEGSHTVATCGCGARYDVATEAGGSFRATLQQIDAHCPKQGCGAVRALPRHLVKPGLSWNCEGCGEIVRVQLGVQLASSQD